MHYGIAEGEREQGVSMYCICLSWFSLVEQLSQYSSVCVMCFETTFWLAFKNITCFTCSHKVLFQDLFAFALGNAPGCKLFLWGQHITSKLCSSDG